MRDPHHALIRWLGNRDPIRRNLESREFVDRLLADLAADRFHGSAWAQFMRRSLARSVDQARIRPQAAAEVTAIHLVAAASGRWRWPLASWLLCITHLGLLGERSTLGWPNRLTLLRALLPAVAPRSPWSSPVALASDFLDGRLARRGEETAFGAFADPIADGVYWSWFALRWEKNRWLRLTPITLFGASVMAIAAAYFARGHAIDYPRPMAVRHASGVAQVWLALRALAR